MSGLGSQQTGAPARQRACTLQPMGQGLQQACSSIEDMESTHTHMHVARVRESKHEGQLTRCTCEGAFWSTQTDMCKSGQRLFESPSPPVHLWVTESCFQHGSDILHVVAPQTNEL